MSFDRRTANQPRPGDESSISTDEPLPGHPEPASRWALPYLSQEDGLWRCYLRKPLTKAEELAGPLYVVIAKGQEELAKLQAHEDEKAARSPTSLAAWQHKNTL